MSEETKHTPGPWVAERICLDGNEWSIKSKCRNLSPFEWNARMSVGLPPLLGFVGDARIGKGAGLQLTPPDVLRENEANAILIAAAPQLLAACEAALDAINRADLGGEVLWVKPPHQLYGVHETASERLMAAIAAAKPAPASDAG